MRESNMMNYRVVHPMFTALYCDAPMTALPAVPRGVAADGT
ncbi:hypothetical protein [Streptomyces acidicola]|nr:hypothetical protein [Streptomyces acidicola]